MATVKSHSERNKLISEEDWKEDISLKTVSESSQQECKMFIERTDPSLFIVESTAACVHRLIVFITQRTVDYHHALHTQENKA